MMISTKGRYALRIMLDLASQPKEKYVSLKEICARQEVSMKYLEAIVSVLNKADMLESLRGKSGGYRLAKSPKEYSIYSILKLTEGSLSPVACIDSEIKCKRSDVCLTKSMWNELGTIIENYLNNKTLFDLLNGDDNNEN